MKSENPPVPPFDHDVAIRKVRFAEDAWNSRDPEKVATAYTTTACGAIARSFSPVVRRLFGF
jgi:nuclear transport factor 2 (NTF2) superfamily protein